MKSTSTSLPLRTTTESMSSRPTSIGPVRRAPDRELHRRITSRGRVPCLILPRASGVPRARDGRRIPADRTCASCDRHASCRYTLRHVRDRRALRRRAPRVPRAAPASACPSSSATCRSGWRSASPPPPPGSRSAQATGCSAVVLAGAGQFIGLAALRGRRGSGFRPRRHRRRQPPLPPLLGDHLAAPEHDEPRWQQMLLAFTLTDETFAVNMSDLREGTRGHVLDARRRRRLVDSAGRSARWSAPSPARRSATRRAGASTSRCRRCSPRCSSDRSTGRREARGGGRWRRHSRSCSRACCPGTGPIVAAPMSGATVMTVATR